MKSSKFSEAQQQAIIQEQGKGKSIEVICREHQISPATFYNWKKNFIEGQDENRRRLYELERENARLKKMYAELRMDHEILQEGYVLAKKILARQDRKS